ncbi:MAG: hypothetical protein BGO49_20230 [Planctomycetales bacterium 71-10]|nr:MAG: hypothetical protein BGO49_20230 [Planctomycetales bacterium 71-10]
MEIIADPVLPPLPADEYEALKASIRERGVLVPILVVADRQVAEGEERLRAFIVDGHERYRACRELKIPPAPLRVLDPTTPVRRRELSIRLNAERRHLSKPDRDRLLEEYIKAAPHKSTREVADACKVSQSKAARAKARLLADESIPSVPTLGRNGKVYKKPTSVGVESLKGARDAAGLLAKLGDQAPEGNQSIRKIRKAEYRAGRIAEADGPLARLPADIQILLNDFRLLEKHTGDLTGKVDLLFCDPPWVEEYRHLLPEFGAMAGRLLKPGGVLLTYTMQSAVPAFLDAITPHLSYQWLMAAVNFDARPKEGRITQNHGQSKIGNGYVIQGWRPLLLFSKGPLKTPRQVNDLVFNTAKEKRLHPKGWQQPLPEARHFVERLSRPGDLIVDLFAGVGTSALAVALAGQGRRFIGCDVDEACVKLATDRVAGGLADASPMAG